MTEQNRLDTDVQVLTLAVQVGMLNHACQAALNLLRDPDADQFDAHKVEKLLATALRGIE